MKDIDRLRLIEKSDPVDMTSLHEAINDAFSQGEMRLRQVQIEALSIIAKYRRGLFSIGVGHGKTIISLLSSIVARSWRTVLMIPSSLVSQLTEVDIAKIEKGFGLKLDWICIQGMSQHSRRNAMNKHRITIMPYSYLSTEDGEELLELSKADLIVLDECQYLKNKNSARVVRFLHYLKKNKDVALVAMSGTMIKKSILDYHHFANFTLRQYSPLPESYVDSVECDALISYNNRSRWGSCRYLQHLADSRGVVIVNDARRFFKTVFIKSPGTVLTENASTDVSLLFDVITDIKHSEKVDTMMNDVLNSWTSPSGDEFEDFISVRACVQQISTGFYYRLFWADGTPQWCIDSWKLENEFKREMRSWIKGYYRPKLDTPKLVRRALDQRIDSVKYLQSFYDAWKESIRPNMHERSRELVWISEYKIEECVKWAKKIKNGIIWFKWDAVGTMLKKRISDATLCKQDCSILDLNKGGILLCSFAHAEGKNLQHQANNLILDIPTNGALFEQLIGRTHRQGQNADCVNFEILLANSFDEDILKSDLMQADALQKIMQEQKLLMGDWKNGKWKNVDSWNFTNDGFKLREESVTV